ncbi:hypothetical protein [Levilactobacillus tongjiangensis]|uniref:D-alanyl-D-alanine carboxypeptidase n=1 Tax=Levilactobacillus tongjiangensis TaxID=2486023 RepID=A0ABW1ST63_9LACO|nr:hypothetical protein [Levilactobacillus tongjiangensis]
MKKFGLTLTLGILSICLSGVTTAKASSYQLNRSHNLPYTQVFHNRNAATHYLWNNTHTRKLHNLRNYPHTSWHVNREAWFSHGNTTAHYYYVVSGNRRAAGWVWRGYLQDGSYYRETVKNDGLKLASPVSFNDRGQFDRFIYQRLQHDGYPLNNQLSMILNYYSSGNDRLADYTIKDVIKTLKLKNLNARDLTLINQPTVHHLNRLADPQHGKLAIETTGKGQLGVSLVRTLEKQLRAANASEYAINTNLTGSAQAGTLKLQYVLLMR